MLFYVKKVCPTHHWTEHVYTPPLPSPSSPQYSLIWNLVPSKRGAFKATKTNFLFLFLMLAVLLASLIPIGYSVARLHPSQTCGPFR